MLPVMRRMRRMRRSHATAHGTQSVPLAAAPSAAFVAAQKQARPDENPGGPL
jgi:hypothetical protein